jgi:DMSO/TMAO reductase YedYZ molybdopterin-dependent catalytic subunit
MVENFISRGFSGRARETDQTKRERIPPGQYETKDFPVLSAGPTPRTPLERWDFSIYGEINEDLKWNWKEFQKLPSETIKVDIHCVTKWSKLDTIWKGISVDTLLKGVDLEAQSDVGYLIAFCDGGYTTNLPLADVRSGKAWVVYEYDGRPLAPEHGGPARLLVPEHYFGKARNGCAALNSSEKIAPVFGRRRAIITTPIPGKNSATRAIKSYDAAA